MQDTTVVEEVIVNAEAEVAYIPALNMAVSTTPAELPKSPTAPTAKTDGDTAQDGMAKWGTDNKEPYRLIDLAESNAVLSQGIYWKSNAITSGGLAYGTLVIDEATGKSRLKRVIDPKVEEFLQRSNVNRYLREAALEFYKFWNVFPELIKSSDGVEIASIACHESAWCRWGVQNAKGVIDTCYINANWFKDAKVTDPETTKLRVIDPYYDPVGVAKADAKLVNFIYPVAGTGSGRAYYQRPVWVSVDDQGWLELANRVAKVKIAILNNQMTVKYHLEIAEWWWEWKYSDWNTKKELKGQRMKEELDKFSEKMKADKGAGNSLLSAKRIIGDKEYSGWSIKAIEDHMKDGKHIADSEAGTTHILFALGLDGTLIGSLPGKGQAGSGSDKRVAMNILIANSKSEQDIILEPLQFIFKFNGYVGENGLPYTIWFENYWITTLDKGKETQQQSS